MDRRNDLGSGELTVRDSTAIRAHPDVDSNDPTLSLDLRSVSHSYSEGGGRIREVLHAVNLRAHTAELVALLGRSGSGKSTLLNLIAGIDRATQAEWIQVAGQDLGGMDEDARTRFRREHIGFVFQFFHLLPTLTVAENVRLPLELAGHRIDSTRVQDLLARVGLADRAESFPDVLSGGEQQRVALARAVVHEPDVLLADEPTGNLDGPAAAQVLDMLVELSRERGCTVLIATHSREAAARCDRVLRLQDGALVQASDA